MSSMYREICSLRRLYAAWRTVRNSAFSSSSDEIKREAEDFESRLPGSLIEIQKSLSKKNFVFLKQTGVAKSKAGGKSRPIVLAPIPNRVVQRALLDVLQAKVKFIKRVLATPTSYGGIQNKRVAMALENARAAISAGAEFHVRSDIPGFFTRINKAHIIKIISQYISCADTVVLFEAAITTDLENIDDLRRKHLAELFPIGIEGVAQGSPLSPLIANIYLHEFDAEMNSGEVCCLRYIDDFLILGKNSSVVDKAFNRSLKLLSKLSLTAYDPNKDKDKASRGLVSRGFDFLGCNVLPGLTQPSESSRSRFKQKLTAEFSAAKHALNYNSKYADGDGSYSYSRALYRIDKIILGWGKAFSFCDGYHCLKGIDSFISSKLEELEKEKTAIYAKTNEAGKRRIIGVRLLLDIHLADSAFKNVLP